MRNDRETPAPSSRPVQPLWRCGLPLAARGSPSEGGVEGAGNTLISPTNRRCIILVLSRLLGQEIEIKTPEGRKIVLRVTEIGGGRVRMAFVADKEVKIHRRELTDPNPTNGAAQ